MNIENFLKVTFEFDCSKESLIDLITEWSKKIWNLNEEQQNMVSASVFLLANNMITIDLDKKDVSTPTPIAVALILGLSCGQLYEKYQIAKLDNLMKDVNDSHEEKSS